MKIKLISASAIIILLTIIISLSLLYLKSETEKLVGYIETEKYEEFYEEYEKSRILLSFLLDGKKIASVDDQIEKLKKTGPDTEALIKLKSDIKDWIVSEYPSVENIF